MRLGYSWSLGVGDVSVFGKAKVYIREFMYYIGISIRIHCVYIVSSEPGLSGLVDLGLVGL